MEENNIQPNTVNLSGVNTQNLQQEVPQNVITNVISNNINSETQPVQVQPSNFAQDNLGQVVQPVQPVVNVPQELVVEQPIVQPSNLTSVQGTQTNITPNTISPENLNYVGTITQSNVITAEVKQDTNNVENNDAGDDDENSKVARAYEVSDKFIISVEDLKEVVKDANKVASNDAMLTLTQVAYLVFDKDGFHITTTSNTQTLTVTSPWVKYTSELKINVTCTTFTNLVMALENGKVEFVWNESNDSLELYAGKGKFVFIPQVDPATGEFITIQHPFSTDVIYKPVNYKNFISVLQMSKPVVELANSTSDSLQMKGVQFDDIIVSSDGNLMLMQKEFADLLNERFFIDSKLLNLLTSIGFQEEDFSVSLVKDNVGVNHAIIIKDRFHVFTSTVIEHGDLPMDLCRNYFKTGFPHDIVFDTNSLRNIIKRVVPFVNFGNDEDYAVIAIENSKASVHSISSLGIDYVDVNNKNNYNGQFKLPVMKLSKVLATVNTPTFTISVDPNNTVCVVGSFNDWKCIIATAQ